MLWFWAIVTFPVGFWHLWHFRSSKELTEKELAEISPKFAEVNARYILFSILWLGGIMGLFIFVVFQKLDNWAVLKYGIRFYPVSISFAVSYGIYQGLFALLSGVYPMGRTLSYVYDDTRRIRHVATRQILISIAAVIVVVLFFFVTN